jgi:hypothetical protein
VQNAVRASLNPCSPFHGVRCRGRKSHTADRQTAPARDFVPARRGRVRAWLAWTERASSWLSGCSSATPPASATGDVLRPVGCLRSQRRRIPRFSRSRWIALDSTSTELMRSVPICRRLRRRRTCFVPAMRFPTRSGEPSSRSCNLPRNPRQARRRRPLANDDDQRIAGLSGLTESVPRYRLPRLAAEDCGRTSGN